MRNNPLKYSDPSGHWSCGDYYDQACTENLEELWDYSQATFPTRFKNSLIKKGNWIPGFSDKLYTFDDPNPIARGTYFAWALSEVLQAGSGLKLAAMDLLIIGGSNTSTGLFGLSVGGDLTSGVGIGGFYSVAYQTILPEGTYPGTSRPYHNKLANQALQADMELDPSFAQAMNGLIPGINNQKNMYSSPSPDWTWHHHPTQPGVMQLVPRLEHTSPLMRWLFLDEYGNGGYANWGR